MNRIASTAMALSLALAAPAFADNPASPAPSPMPSTGNTNGGAAAVPGTNSGPAAAPDATAAPAAPEASAPEEPSSSMSKDSASAEPAMHHHHRVAMTARRGESSPAEQRETKALNVLEENGYGDFSDVKPDGSNFIATVNRDGSQVRVLVDPESGKVTPQNRS